MIRIVAGEFRGRKINTPPEGDASIRPTTDRVREAIFNMLLSNYGLPDDARVLDLCCGTGALGLESMSRGAAHVTFIDNQTTALKLVRETVQAYKAENRAQILLADVKKLPAVTAPFDLVFCDPPYRKDVLPAAVVALQAKNYLAAHTLLVLETAADEDLNLPDFTVQDVRVYGAAKVWFFSK